MDIEAKQWVFPKLHTHFHAFYNIWEKGVTRNYNTKFNEAMHGPIKKIYQNQTNLRSLLSPTGSNRIWSDLAQIRSDSDQSPINFFWPMSQPNCFKLSDQTWSESDRSLSTLIRLLRSDSKLIWSESEQNPLYRHFIIASN